MTSHHDIYTTTDVKPEMIPGIQTGNGIPLDKCNLRGIAHASSNKKDDIFMQRRLYIDEAHTALDIFRFAVFFCCIFEVKLGYNSANITIKAQIFTRFQA